MKTIDSFSGASLTFDSTMDEKLEVRANGGLPMFDKLVFPPAPGNTIIETVNADAVALQEIRAMPGTSINGIAEDFIVLGPSQSCAFVSDGAGNYITIRKPDRVKFKGDTVSYVDVDLGNDGNSGISAGAPFKTMQAALNWLFVNGDMGGFRYVLQAADSPNPYAGFSIRGGMTGHYGNPSLGGVLASFTVLGNRSDPSKVIIDGSGVGNAIEVLVGKSLHVDGVTVQSDSGSGIYGILPGTEICPHQVNYGPCAYAQIYAGANAAIIIEGDQRFMGDAQFAIYANQCSTVNTFPGESLHFHGARNYSGFVIGSARSSAVDLGDLDFVVEPGGSVTGQRWKTLLNGTIDAQFRDLDLLIPGTITGNNNYGGRTTP